MPNLNYLQGTVTGPLMPDAIAAAEDLVRRRNPLFRFDPEYLDHERQNHGGIPAAQWFHGASGTWYRLTRFLNLGGIYDPPMRESLLYAGADERTQYTLEWAFAMPNIAAGCGPLLVPFALIASAPPYEEARELNDADLLCFDYRTPAVRPAVVAWISQRALDEGRRSIVERIEIDYSRFTDLVAADFGAFLHLLVAEAPPNPTPAPTEGEAISE